MIVNVFLRDISCHDAKPLEVIIIIIIIFSFYIALITNVCMRFTNILLTRSLDLVLACTQCAHSPLPGEHSSQALLDAQKLFDQQ